MGPARGPAGGPGGGHRRAALGPVGLLALAFAVLLAVAHLSGASSLARLLPTATTDAGQADRVEQVDGPPGTTLYLSGWEPASVQLDSGLATRLPDPVGGRADLATVDGRVVALSGGAAWVLPATGSGRARRLGFADSILPSRWPGRIWLVTIDYAHAAAYDMVEVGIGDGRILARHILPAWAPPVAVTSAGLVARNFVDGGIDLRGPGRRVRRLSTDRQAGFVDAHGDLIAWTDAAGLHLYQVRDAAERVVRPPTTSGGWVTYGPIGRSACCLVTGAFSPDGRTLALFTTINSADDLGLALVDVGRASVAGVPRSGDAIPGSCQACLAWSGDGAWLFYLGITPGSIWGVRMGGDGAAPLAVSLDGVTDAPFDGLAAA